MHDHCKNNDGGYHGNHHVSGSHSFCHTCGHPSHQCCCHHPHCRREMKELLVEPGSSVQKAGLDDDFSKTVFSSAAGMLKGKISDEEMKSYAGLNDNEAVVVAGKFGRSGAFIGGGCCVHLSVEYMPHNALSNNPGMLLIAVLDSEATILSWGKVLEAHSRYKIKEDIITTYPGARLIAIGFNVVARIRWCEVFSC